MLRAATALQLSRLLNGKIILNYQMGKAGSSSIQEAIRTSDAFASFHVHRLMPASTEQIQLRYRAGEKYYRDMCLEELLFNHFRRTGRSAKIVCPIREPFSHSYSSFFQNLPRSTRGRATAQTATIDQLKALFLNWEELGRATHWIDDELSAFLNFDVLSIPFDRTKGWAIFECGPYEVLILKSEIGDDIKSRALETFLGTKGIQVSRSNIATSKPYDLLYRKFIDQVKIPEDIASRWLNSRYVKTFYSEKELAETINTHVEFGSK